MTDNDYRIEDRFEKGRPNYTLRRLKFTLAVVGLVVSVTLMLTWHGGGLTGALVVEGVYLVTALWLTVRFAPRDDVDGDVWPYPPAYKDAGGWRRRVSLHLTLHFTHALSRLPLSHSPLWVRIPPPALGRTVNAARIPASFSFLGGVGTMGVLLCCHGAQRSGSYQSISYQSIKVKGGTDEGDSAALAFQSERSGRGRRHGGDDAW